MRQSAAVVKAKPDLANATVQKPVAFSWKNPDSLVDLFKMSPVDRVRVVKRGVTATTVVRIAKATGRPKDRVIHLLGLPRSTVDRKVRNNERLPIDQGERVLGFLKLVGQVQSMVEESGDPTDFDAARWVSSWLERPVPALGGKCPEEFMDTTEGQQVVAGLIAGARGGAFG